MEAPQTPREETFDPQEMRDYGYDPESPEDRAAWATTTPAGGIPKIQTYKDDVFVYGSAPVGQQGSDAVQ